MPGKQWTRTVAVGLLASLASGVAATSEPSREGGALLVLLQPGVGAPTPEEVIERAAAGLDLPGDLGFGAPAEIRFLIPERAKGHTRSIYAARPDLPAAVLQRYLVLSYSAGTDLDAVVSVLERSPHIGHVEPGQGIGYSPVPLDPYFAQTDGQGNPLPPELHQWAGYALSLPQAWDLTKGHAYLGVVDNGIATQHDEFRGLSVQDGEPVYEGGNFRPHLSFDYGYLDAEVDEADPQGIAPQVDVAGHGTHVSGILAAHTDNPVGVAGTCWHCSLMVMKNSVLRQIGGRWYNRGHPDHAFDHTVAAAHGGISRGAQVLNLSAGFRNIAPCLQDPQNSLCQALALADDRDVAFAAAAGNDGLSVLDFPASDPRVFGAAGLRPDGSFWDDCPPPPQQRPPECGSNFGPGLFAAPAKQVLSTFYPNLPWSPEFHCSEELLPGQVGYGPCTGTSMASPYLAGSLGILRSVNPLLSTAELRSVLLANLDNPPGWNPQHGHGKPDVAASVRAVLGRSGGQFLTNRLTPLFAAWSPQAEVHLYSTAPQMISAAFFDPSLFFASEPLSPMIPGYDEFPGAEPCTVSPCLPWFPRASVHLFTTDRPPYPGAPALVPLYRMSSPAPWGTDPQSRAFFYTTQEGALLQGKEWGYDLDGREGYLFPRCTPEATCMPPGTVRLYRLYHPGRDDYALFPETELPHWLAQGYISQPQILTDWIGYVYPNVDTDGDQVIDGFERVLGTDPLRADTDCDGLSDGDEVHGYPSSDPLLGGVCEPAMAEVGYLPALSSAPQQVILQHTFTNPIVFAQPVSNQDPSAASAVRIVSVQSDRFSAYVQEAPNHDGVHVGEKIAYLVVEAGRWQLANGAILEARKLATSATVNRQVTPRPWVPVAFSSPFTQPPAVFTQTQTAADPHWVKTRQLPASKSGFSLALEEEEAKLAPHGTESVGWLAVLPGFGSWSGRLYEAGTVSGVTDAWRTIAFAQPYAEQPRFLADLASYAGADNAGLRRAGQAAAQIQVRVEEDTTYDAETTHFQGEDVSYLAIGGDGLLRATAVP